MVFYSILFFVAISRNGSIVNVSKMVIFDLYDSVDPDMIIYYYFELR